MLECEHFYTVCLYNKVTNNGCVTFHYINIPYPQSLLLDI